MGEFSISLIVTLILSGILVGFINSSSAGGTIISIALYLALGLPPAEANATNRLGVLIQSIASTGAYKAQNVLEIKPMLRFSVPTILGALVGSLFAVFTDGEVFRYALGLVILVMIFFTFYNPKTLKQGNPELQAKGFTWVQFIAFFCIGVFGGFVQVGTGFFLIMACIMLGGFDVIRSNALKAGIMLMYTIVTLVVFGGYGTVHWGYGLLHGAGCTVGAVIGARLSVKKGVSFIKWITVLVTLITAAELFGIIDFGSIFKDILKK